MKRIPVKKIHSASKRDFPTLHFVWKDESFQEHGRLVWDGIRRVTVPLRTVVMIELKGGE